MSEPSLPSAAVESTPAPAAPETASFFEDVIDIFYQPSAVFARRRNGNPWLPLLFVVIAIGVISFFTFSAMQPAIEAEIRRAMATASAKNPGMTPEMIDKAVSIQTTIGRYVAAVFIGFAILLVGLATWLVSKMFGAAETFGQAILIAGYAYFPRVLGSILGAVIALITDPAQMTGAAVLSVGPAHFLNPESANPMLMALFQRLDLMVIWETALLAIGVAVIGKIPRNKALVFAIIMWLLGSLPQLRTAFLAS